jgi:phosphate transport system substrate-binding protein
MGILCLLLLVSCRPSTDDFLLAAKQGDLDQIGRLLDRGIDISVRNRKGETALHLVAQWKRAEAAAMLLARGAPLEAVDLQGRTPLHSAAKDNQESLVKLLLEHGARIDATDYDGATPLHVAAEWDAGDAARILIDRGAPLLAQDREGMTPLHSAATWGAEQVAAVLLDVKASVQATGRQGETPLHLTSKGTRRLFEASQRQLGVAQLLLAHGAAVDAVQLNGYTPLHLAAQQGYLEMAQFLINRGASINLKARDGRTPLHEAVAQNHLPCARLLLDRGADIGIPAGQGKTPLHIAAELGQVSMVRLLLDKGSPVIAIDTEGRTPLHEPATRGHEAVVQLLLEREASPHVVDLFGWTPLHLATFHGREPIVRLLLDRGAQVNAVDARGVTPLHGAAYYGYDDIYQLLIQRGARMDLADNRGYTAAQYARPPSRTDAGEESQPGEAVRAVHAAQEGVVRLQLPLIKMDGSSTVYPISALVAERFAEVVEGTARLSVGISGTGGGFQKFCRGQVDVQGASRPITTDESTLCQSKGVQFYELPIAYDALSVAVSANNSWVESLSLKDLKRMWEPAAQGKIATWKQVRSEWPDLPLKLYGAGRDSGSFDYFTEAVMGKPRISRTDYTGSEDDNFLVDAIADSRHNLGYVPFAYLEPNRRRLKAVAIDVGKGPVLPTKEAVLAGQYQPLSRPIFIYVNRRSSIDSAIREFVEYYLTHAPELAELVGYVPFEKEFYPRILGKFHNGRTGTIFEGKSPIGMTIQQFLAVEQGT